MCGGGREWGGECAMVGGGKQVMVAKVSGGRWPDGASPPPDRQGVGAGQKISSSKPMKQNLLWGVALLFVGGGL